jgi:hypothetical protein
MTSFLSRRNVQILDRLLNTLSSQFMVRRSVMLRRVILSPIFPIIPSIH